MNPWIPISFTSKLAVPPDSRPSGTLLQTFHSLLRWWSRRRPNSRSGRVIFHDLTHLANNATAGFSNAWCDIDTVTFEFANNVRLAGRLCICTGSWIENEESRVSLLKKETYVRSDGAIGCSASLLFKAHTVKESSIRSHAKAEPGCLAQNSRPR
jgi:hypothetical protein